MGRPVLAVDVDETIGQYTNALDKFILREYNIKFTLSEYRSHDYFKAWGVDETTGQMIMSAFVSSEDFLEIPVIPGSIEAITTLAQYFDLQIVTSRNHRFASITWKWLEFHFPHCFSAMHFTNFWPVTEDDRKLKKEDKGQICERIGAVALIDDTPWNLIKAIEHNVLPVQINYQGKVGWANAITDRRILIYEYWSEIVTMLLKTINTSVKMHYNRYLTTSTLTVDCTQTGIVGNPPIEVLEESTQKDFSTC